MTEQADLFKTRVTIGNDASLIMRLARDTALRQAVEELEKSGCKLPGMILATALVRQIHNETQEKLSLQIYRAASRAGVRIHEIAQIGTEIDLNTGSIDLIVTTEAGQ